MFFGGGKRGKRSPRVAPAGGFFPRTARLVKQGLLRVRASGAGLAHGRAYSSRASRLIVWKMAYCLHLPTPPSPVPRPADPPQHGPPLCIPAHPSIARSIFHSTLKTFTVAARSSTLNLVRIICEGNCEYNTFILSYLTIIVPLKREKRERKKKDKENKSTRFKIDTMHR